MARKILFITHQLSKTGAPIVLLDMIRYCHRRGDDIIVITMMEGELRADLEQMDIPVLVQEHFLENYTVFLRQAQLFDLVVANTLITFEAVHILKMSSVPVIWWLHEGRQYFEYFASVLPDFHSLPDNIYVFPVSGYVQDALSSLYGYQAPLLPIGVADAYEEPECTDRASLADTDMKLVICGTYSSLKGQDLLAAAVRRLPDDYISRFQMEFYGNLDMRDEAIYAPVRQLCDDFPNIRIMPFTPHDKMLQIIASCDCLVIPSRIDPLPTVAVEAMMQHVPCLCSDACGIARHIIHGQNGLLFHSEDIDDLARMLKYLLDNRPLLKTLGHESRKVYESIYSMDTFEVKVEELINSIK